MGLFGKMFEKKTCAICGKETGAVFGRKKIADGYICTDCNKQLSPYFEGRRDATAADIQEQLKYREANKAEVANFHVTRTIGNSTKVYLDEDAAKAIITRSTPSQWASENPDVFEFGQITGADYEIDETRTEVFRTDREGNEVSYNPPRYEYSYDIYVTISLNHPYAHRIRFQLNTMSIDRQESAEFHRCEQQAREIKDAFTDIHNVQRAAAAPKTAVTCPHCGATTMPDVNGRCEYCGGAVL